MSRFTFVFLIVCLQFLTLLAESREGLLGNFSLDGKKNQSSSEMLIAQSYGEDSYDPFADYSEFEEAADEEADINFFRNGRFFNIGFIGGVRNFTGNLGSIYSTSPSYGMFLSYFFDLRFALQIGFQTGDHRMEILTDTKNIIGNVSLTTISFDLKYYFNTQNVTRGLADLNPYLLGGFSQYYRTHTVLEESGFARDNSTGVNLAVGIEIPMLRNKMYFGFQASYNLVNFKDENQELVLSDGTQTGIFRSGDIMQFQGILGINF